MARQDWAEISDEKAARRLGERLGVVFDAPAVATRGGDEGAFALAGEEAWVALLLERKHGHPVENVLQFWPWLERNRRRLVLVHAIAPDARRRTGSRADLTVWLGAMMERVLRGRFAYCRVDLGSATEGPQLDAARAAIEALRQPLEGRGLLGNNPGT